MARDPYQELGVSRSASADEIRKAFRKLAKQYHPDTNPGDKGAEEKFKRVSAAFDILGDADKRKKFDRGEIDADGRETARGYGGGAGGPWGGGPQYRGSRQGGPGGPFGAEFEGVDLDDILGGMFGGGGRRGGGMGGRGADVRAKLDIDIEDSILGGRKRIAFSDGRTLDVTIPKGAFEGQVLRLKGQGSPGRTTPGDALIELHIRSHPIYRRKRDALVMDLPISLPDAVLGGKVQAPTPEGPVSIKVPKGSNSGAVLRLKGRGVIDPQTGRRGDLLAKLVVTLPEGNDPELEALAEKIRRERPYTPRR